MPFVVDNTVPSPYLCQPLEHGADIVVHSATKYIGGHGTTMGGVIVESGKFPWDNGKFPGMTTPSPGYHGVIFHETFGDFGFTMRCAHGDAAHVRPGALAVQRVAAAAGARDAAGAHGPPLRERARGREVPGAAPAGIVGELSRPARQQVLRARAQVHAEGRERRCSRSASRAAHAAGEKFIEAATFMSHLANIGDAKTLIIHPASTTHRQMSEDEQAKAGVTPDMIRVSVGLETLDDILWDIDQALHAAAHA